MHFLTKTLTLTLITLGLTACGGSSEGGKTNVSSSSKPLSSSTSSSSLVPSSSSAAMSSSLTSISSSSIASSSSTSSEASSSSSSLAFSSASSSSAGYSVAEIEDCGVNEVDPDDAEIYTLIADYDTNTQNKTLTSISGWNHSTNENSGRSEWVNLAHEASTYNFSATTAANESCNNVDTLNMVLVKKIADWDFQHANGIEKTINTAGKKFGDVENLVVELKVNSDKTTIPTVTDLKDIYVPTYVNTGAVDALDSGKVNIGITLYDGFGSTVWSGMRIIELDQAALADKWIRVTIPVANLKFCSTTSYNCTTKTLADLSNKVIYGVRFVAETKSGVVLRNSITTWSSTIPETFKEVDLSIKKIEFQLK